MDANAKEIAEKWVKLQPSADCGCSDCKVLRERKALAAAYLADRGERAEHVAALEDAWYAVSLCAYQCWDTLDGLEKSIAKLTGETDGQVSKRLSDKHRGHFRRRGELLAIDERAQHIEKTAALAARVAELAELLSACIEGLQSYLENWGDRNDPERIKNMHEVVALAIAALAGPGKGAGT